VRSVLKACDTFVIAVRAVAVRPGAVRSREDRRSPDQVLRRRQGVVRTGPQRSAVFAGISRQDHRAAFAQQAPDAGMQQVRRERAGAR